MEDIEERALVMTEIPQGYGNSLYTVHAQHFHPTGKVHAVLNHQTVESQVSSLQ